MLARWTRPLAIATLVVLVNLALAWWYYIPDHDYFLEQSLASAPVHLTQTSGVTGRLWTAKRKLRAFSKPWAFRDERDLEKQPGLTGGTEIDAWFRPQEQQDGPDPAASVTERGAQDFACRSEKWVVITTVFGPTKLAHQLEGLPGWCTVVVADQKTPVAEWVGQGFERVKLLTLEQQSKLGFKILDLIPLNHFGRKNIGYLYAIRAGARYIYDTDDDNMLKSGADGNPVDIPIVDARQPGHFVAQAWPCNFSDDATRSWNPYAVYGQPTAWPRGLPLEDIRATSQPCGHAAAAREMEHHHAAKANVTHAPYTYHTVFHRLPGITFPVQQSLADVHPDVDAIYRLTRYPPTFEFDVAETNAAGVYGPDRVYAPYNAQATLHHHAAFWAMLLPVTVHGRVSDIWRSYVAQRLMEKYGMRVAFMKPWVDQERTAHDYLRDFDSEQPLYLRAGGVLDFLRDWQPGRDDLTLAAEQEELMMALYERGLVEEQDVLLTQAWLQDLGSMGYAFPDARARFYEVWSQQQFLGGLAILTDEHLNATELKSVLPLVDQQLGMFSAKAYPVMVFHIDNGEADGWMNRTMKEDLRRLAPDLRLEFYATQYTWPRGDGYGQDGYMFCSQFLSYEMYRHPAIRRLRYLWRLDEDVTSFTEADQTIALDFFQLMAAEGIDVVRFQRATEFSHVMERMCPRSQLHLLAAEAGPRGTQAWQRVQDTFCSQPEFVAGFNELYNLRATFLNASYFEYLESIDFLQGIYRLDWREQSFKTIWLQAASTDATFRDLRHELPRPTHKNQDHW